jgi:cyclopropane-fatty-acyl-phospholipid synthase
MSAGVDPLSSPVLVSPANFQQAVRGLPFLVRRALRYGLDLQRGSLIVESKERYRLLFRGNQPGPQAQFIIHDMAFARRLALGGDIGLAESFLQGEWDTPDLTAFIELFAVNYEAIASLLPNNWLARFWQSVQHRLNRNTRRGSRRNIHAHYDLGNRFYGAWLDETMTYSSALFSEEAREYGDNDLSSAQNRKYRSLARDIGIQAHHHVLEIGCGWGGFAEFAAREIGCRVTGLTISQEQYTYACQRISEAGLSDRVTFRFQDYRDEMGTYDHIVSIEMFEAVGEEYWDPFFKKLYACLKPGGRAGLQVITLREESLPYYRKEMDFIRHYVFPGGMLPTLSILKTLGEYVQLPMQAERAFGLDYARTLNLWRDNFRKAWPTLVGTGGFDERFRRLWEYYLAYCEAGFRSGNIDVRQLIYAKN